MHYIFIGIKKYVVGLIIKTSSDPTCVEVRKMLDFKFYFISFQCLFCVHVQVSVCTMGVEIRRQLESFLPFSPTKLVGLKIEFIFTLKTISDAPEI